MATVNTTLTLAKDAEVLKCCWNRHEQICAATGDCDGGGEGCVENGTRTHDHGVVRCLGAWELSVALQRLQRVGTRRAAALSVLTRELIAARTLAKLALRELRAKAQTNRAKSLQVPMFTALGRGSCCHSAEGCKTTQMAQEVLHGTRLFCQVRHRTLVSAALGWGRRGPHGLLLHARGSRAQTRCAEKSSCSGFDTDGQTCRLRFGAPVTATSEPPVRLAGPRCQYYRCYSAWSQTVLAPAGAGVTRSNKLL